jgi:hypothetical protein
MFHNCLKPSPPTSNIKGTWQRGVFAGVFAEFSFKHSKADSPSWLVGESVFGTDPDRNRALEKPPAAELIPCHRKPLRRTRTLRDPKKSPQRGRISSTDGQLFGLF